MILDSIKDDYVVDWIGYLDTALMHNWKLNNTILSIEFSIKEIYGEEYSNIIIEKLRKIFS